MDKMDIIKSKWAVKMNLFHHHVKLTNVNDKWDGSLLSEKDVLVYYFAKYNGLKHLGDHVLDIVSVFRNITINRKNPHIWVYFHVSPLVYNFAEGENLKYSYWTQN